MTAFNLVLLVCLATIAVTNAATVAVCQRETGDELLFSQPLLKVSLLGSGKIQKTFPGYKITCIESVLPLGLLSILDLNVFNGGIGCDEVGLQIRVGRLMSIGLQIDVYGIKANASELALTCDN